MCFEIGRAEVGVVESSVGKDLARSVEGLCIELDLDRVLEEDVVLLDESLVPGIPVISPVVGVPRRRYLVLLLLVMLGDAPTFLLTLGVASDGSCIVLRPRPSLPCIACIVYILVVVVVSR